MGCSSRTDVREDIKLSQEMIYLNLDGNHHKKDLEHAQSLINLITRIRNKMIYLYHHLIYDTGACLFLNPTISHCFKSVLYKLSTDLEGKIENCKMEIIEDPPYLKIEEINKITSKGREIMNELFSFIAEIKSYKTIIKQIDKETPGLLYIVFENKHNISSENINSINKGIELFKNMINLRTDIINIYKIELRYLIANKQIYFEEIDKIGQRAYKEQISDVYEITFLKKDDINKNDYENQMYSSIKDAKNCMEKILKQEINDDILNSHESIIIEQNDDI
jgi:hypothetical protein